MKIIEDLEDETCKHQIIKYNNHIHICSELEERERERTSNIEICLMYFCCCCCI